MLGKGLTEEKLKRLVDLTKSLEEEGFGFVELPGGYFIEKYVHKDNFSEENKEEVANILVDLIQKSRKRINEIVENP